MKKFIASLISLSLLLAMIPSVFAATQAGLFLTDAKAGQTGRIFANGTPNAEVTIIMVDPEGGRSAITLSTDKEGKINEIFNAPEEPGKYQAYISGRKDQSLMEFNVLTANEPSEETSEVTTTARKAFADGEDSITVKASIRDEDFDAVVGREIMLDADGNGIVVDIPSATTDKRGRVEFDITAFEAGDVSLAVYDAVTKKTIGEVSVEFITASYEDTYADAAYPTNYQANYPNYPVPAYYPQYPYPYPQQYAPQAPQYDEFYELKMLDQKLKELEKLLGPIEASKTSRGGDLLQASILDVKKAYAQGGLVDHFEFVDLDEGDLEVDEPLSFSIRALDVNDEIVTDYTGTVTFSSDNSDALLPEDYEFELADQGEHEFALALIFLDEGDYTLTVADVEDEDIKGEMELMLGSGVTAPASAVRTIELTSPLPGTYASTVQTVAGQTRENSTVTIFDGTKIVGSVNTDTEGNFSFQVTGLTEGEHTFKIESEYIPNGDITDSTPVELTIDVSPPVVTSIAVSPKEIEEGDQMTVKVVSEAQAAISVVINNLSYDLTETSRGNYEGQIIAPNEAGEYTVNVIAADKFGNEGNYPNEADITVKPKKKPITNVLALSGEETLDLEWDVFLTAARYRVSYGTQPENYTQQIVTIDATAAWTLRNLQGNTTYYLTVEALDKTGKVISLPSEETSARVLARVVAAVQDPIQPPSGDQVTQTGPEVYVILLASLVFLDMYARVRRRLTRNEF